jgi:hypothetical protein
MMDVKSAVGTKMTLHAMEPYFLNAFVTLLMVIERFTRKRQKGMFVPLVMLCGTNW